MPRRVVFARRGGDLFILDLLVILSSSLCPGGIGRHAALSSVVVGFFGRKGEGKGKGPDKGKGKSHDKGKRQSRKGDGKSGRETRC